MKGTSCETDQTADEIENLRSQLNQACLEIDGEGNSQCGQQD
jgi:hypothetical protein